MSRAIAVKTTGQRHFRAAPTMLTGAVPMSHAACRQSALPRWAYCFMQDGHGHFPRDAMGLPAWRMRMIGMPAGFCRRARRR